MGILLIVFGSAISVYTGWLIVKCAEYCNASRYEDIAMRLYGPRMSKFTSFMILLTMLGFVIAYIVLVSCFNYPCVTINLPPSPIVENTAPSDT